MWECGECRGVRGGRGRGVGAGVDERSRLDDGLWAASAGGPLPRQAFRSFLATAGDPSPKLRGRGSGGVSESVNSSCGPSPREQVKPRRASSASPGRGLSQSQPRALARGGAGAASRDTTRPSPHPHPSIPHPPHTPITPSQNRSPFPAHSGRGGPGMGARHATSPTADDSTAGRTLLRIVGTPGGWARAASRRALTHSAPTPSVRPGRPRRAAGPCVVSSCGWRISGGRSAPRRTRPGTRRPPPTARSRGAAWPCG
jgi:hypothetical protein